MSLERSFPWYARSVVHLLLIGGGLFFVLPLVWMIATSLKPLDQTLKPPTSLGEALIGTGYQVEIDGVSHEVSIERTVEVTPQSPVFVVRVQEPVYAGELVLSFGPEVWKQTPAFSERELARMNAIIEPGSAVLAADNNRFDPAASTLRLASGRSIPAKLVRELPPSSPDDPYRLVREWRPSDTDVKALASTIPDVTRAWTVVPQSKLEEVPRIIFENYPVALRQVHFGRSLGNTLFICLMVVTGTVISCAIVAYGFAFLSFPGRDLLFAITLATIMIPFPVVMIPHYLLYRELDWIGTFKPLWVVAWFGNAFVIFLLRQFFLGLPRDMLDAARLDGCSELQILWHVVVPLARPALAMVALFAFIHAWKDFLGPLIYLNHESQFTLSLSLQAFASEHGGTPWHLLMAASTVFSLPLIILFFFTLRTFIRGVAMTGMKG